VVQVTHLIHDGIRKLILVRVYKIIIGLVKVEFGYYMLVIYKSETFRVNEAVQVQNKRVIQKRNLNRMNVSSISLVATGKDLTHYQPSPDQLGLE